MKYQDLKITGLEVVGDIAFSYQTEDGGLFMIYDSDVSSVENGSITEIVTDFNIIEDKLYWREQIFNLNLQI